MKFLTKLDSRCPQGFTTAGATLFFRKPLTTSQARAAFNHFPVIVCVQMPDGYFIREDFEECRHDPSCGAYKAMNAVATACGETSIEPSP